MFFVKEAKAEVTKIITPHLIISACMGSLTGKKDSNKITMTSRKKKRKVFDKMAVSGEKEADFMGNLADWCI